MLFPERFNFNNNLFDDFFTDPVFNMTTTNRMSTDIKEKDNGYELAMEVPGFNKEDLKLDLEDGYLTISAEHNTTKIVFSAEIQLSMRIPVKSNVTPFPNKKCTVSNSFCKRTPK